MNNYYIILPHDDYVAHHGILGQKWGVRRYQNADGSLTEAGKKKYSKRFNKAYSEYMDSKEGYGKYHRMNSQKRDAAIKANRAKTANSIESDMLLDTKRNISDDYRKLYKTGKNGRDFDDEYEYVRPEASKEYKKTLNLLMKDNKAWNSMMDNYFSDTRTKNRVSNFVNDLLDEEERRPMHKN